MADDEPRRWTWRVVLGGAGVLAIVLVGVVLWSWLGGDPDFPPLPVPNGHDDLTRASKTIQGDLPLPAVPRDAAPEDLRRFVESNERPLALLRVGLGKTCGVPLFATLQEQVEAAVSTAGPIRKLGRLVESQGWIARKAGRKDEAIRAGLDLLRLGNESARGGLMTQYQLGCALNRMGVGFLAGLRPELDAGDCRRLIRALEAIDASSEPAAAVFARERAFARRRSPWPIRIQWALAGARLERLLRSGAAASELAGLRKAVQTRVLMAELAVDAYRREHGGAAPEGLADLVPGELPAVPIDPFDGRPLRYRKEPSGEVRVYSVGPDRQDDGGTSIPPTSPNSRGDLGLESR